MIVYMCPTYIIQTVTVYTSNTKPNNFENNKLLKFFSG